ncbi:Calcium uniporter protein mitochondrial, partial [Dissostichus eleginoides]
MEYQFRVHRVPCTQRGGATCSPPSAAQTGCVSPLLGMYCLCLNNINNLSLVYVYTMQEVLSAPFTRQTVRKAHGLRSAAHSTIFTQPPTALSPQ